MTDKTVSACLFGLHKWEGVTTNQAYGWESYANYYPTENGRLCKRCGKYQKATLITQTIYKEIYEN